MWFVALQPCQGQPCDCFEHLLVITLSTWAKPLRKKNGAHVVKRGIRITLLLLGIPPKLITSFFPDSKTCYGVFSPEKLWCDPVQLQYQVPETVRRVPVQIGDMAEGSGADGVLEGFWRFWQMADEVPEGWGAASRQS